ncbi:SDR family NAD(P)-dependent oxidoreductase [Shimia marina]|uniref:3-oxoacyl-[acyl-carrier-protein] reductase FabG n=1 Tax=Shimia marina TaxID=321267 RepID=A0A0P1EQ70_9RHOB|nr:SDR family oxidoreductase [Shimia marina]CUH52343.1 3-oxoacyl-[acyl-carrier-protein] reductase FabG [Shimia marina]SFE09301.1 NAD(P)-dependent dehydrogenase, short-chain alcohol dehydrogenase family [Shimia marina]
MSGTIFPDLKGKSVYITGGASGIGAALTDGFMAQGAKVAVIGRSPAEAFIAEMETKHGATPLFMQCDIADVPRLRETIQQAVGEHGGLDVLVNNAANDQRHALDEVDEAFYDWMQAVNLKAYYFACQEAARQMDNGGAIINFSSISYMMGNTGYSIYTTANAGITGMTRSLARELGPKGIRVNALAPGWVLTQKQLDMWADPEALAGHMERQCLKEHLKPEDMIDPTLYLASQASRMMTGQCMAVDGGVVVSG